MRLWSLHPQSLDTRGLVACWREALLAQKVLRGLTRGYVNHSQLIRFRALSSPVQGIGAYLWEVATEADRRGYRFNRELIIEPPGTVLPLIDVPVGQLDYERWLLAAKRRQRGTAPAGFGADDIAATVHPVFRTVAGPIEPWEKVLPGYGLPADPSKPSTPRNSRR